MVVDDSLLTAQKLGSILRQLGHTVAGTCRSGAEAIREFPRVKPDLITMDITMPEMNGIDATWALLAKYPEAQIIMVTSHGQEQMVIQALDAGARGYVLKPVKIEKLDLMIKQLQARTR